MKSEERLKEMNTHQLFSHSLAKEFYALMQLIEKLPGSPDQTAAVMKCGEVAGKVEKEINWLIAEVKRLRAVLKTISTEGELKVSDYYDEEFKDGAKEAFKMCANTASKALNGDES